jgi:hypothetical protein
VKEKSSRPGASIAEEEVSIAEEEVNIVAEEARIVAEEAITVATVESTEVAEADIIDASRMMPLREKKASLSTIRLPEVNREAAALTEVVVGAKTSTRERQDLKVLKLNIRNIMKEPNTRVATEADVVVEAATEATEVVVVASTSMREKQELRVLKVNIRNIMKEPKMRVATEAAVVVEAVIEVITINPERKTHSIATSKERVKVVRTENLSDTLTSLLPKESHMVSKDHTKRNLTIPEDPGLTVKSRFRLTQ